MKLSDKAYNYYSLSCVTRTNQINDAYKKKFADADRRAAVSGGRASIMTELNIQRWREIVDVQKASFIETYEKFRVVLEPADVDEFCLELERTIQDILSMHQGLKSYEFHAINMSAKSQLTLYLMEQELSVNKETKIPVSQTTANFYAPVTGAIQVAGTQNTQIVSIHIDHKFDEAINELLQLVKASSLNPHDKDDAIEAVERLPKLAKDKENPEALERAGKRLTSLETIFSKGGNILEMARPALKIVADWFQS